MVLYVGKSRDYDTLSESTGVRVFIYNHSTIYAEVEGTDVSAEKDTNIAIYKKISNSLEVPYSNCKVSYTDGLKLEEEVSREYVDLFANLGLRYRAVNCDNICIQMEVYKACGCVDLHVKFDNIEKLDVTRFCNHKHNTTDSICIENLSKNADFHDLCLKKCPLECDYTLYTFSTSFSVFPTESAYSRLKSSSAYLRSEDASGNVNGKLLKVNVFFDEMSYGLYSESPAMTIQGLLGNLGGTLGLFLGFSVLSTIEVIEFMINFYIDLKESKRYKTSP